MGNRDKEKDYRHLQILEIALDRFIAKGYYGASTREICKIAGISSGLLFHYFDTKLALYEALIEIGCGKLTLDHPKTASPAQIFKQKLFDMMQMIVTKPFPAKMFVFMGYAVYNAAQISPKAGLMLAQHDLIGQSVPLIQGGQRLGEIRSGDAPALSVAFWCSLQGIAEAMALNPAAPCPDAAWILDILLLKKESE